MNLSFQQWMIESGFVWAQFLVAIPWMVTLFFSENSSSDKPKSSALLTTLVTMFILGGIFPPIFHTFLQETNSIETAGRVYGGVFQTQLILDTFVLTFSSSSKFGPKAALLLKPLFVKALGNLCFGFFQALPFCPPCFSFYSLLHLRRRSHHGQRIGLRYHHACSGGVWNLGS